MRNKTIIFLLISILAWSLLTYILISENSSDLTISKPKKNSHILLKILKLDNELNQLITSNEELIKNIKVNYSSIFNQNKNDEVSPEKAETNGNKDEEIRMELDLHKDSFVKAPVIAVLVLTCNRVTVQRCLDQLLQYRKNAEQFPIIVSQDCAHEKTAEILRSYGNRIIYLQQPDQSDIEVSVQEQKFKGYFKISRHYKWALNQVFMKYKYEAAIVVEDDLDVSSDFYEYFLATYPILINDSSLWCVSAWNDNGKATLVDSSDPSLLYRTDFFPGLGWMLTRNLWLEIGPKFPNAYWDDWIRRPEQRKDRSCIRPELSRTRTFGKIGVSNGLFFEKHLKFIKLNEKFVPFTEMNLTYLIKNNYDSMFVKKVYDTRPVNYIDLKLNNESLEPGTVRISYSSRNNYKSIARYFGLMDDFKSGVPRTGYKGIISFFYNGRRVYLAPNFKWTRYETTWS